MEVRSKRRCGHEVALLVREATMRVHKATMRGSGARSDAGIQACREEVRRSEGSK